VLFAYLTNSKYIEVKDSGMNTMNLKKLMMASALSAGLALVSGAAFAKGENATVEGQLDQNRVVMVNGKEVLQAADKVNPGDLLEYRVRYANKGTAVANNLIVTLPIPRGLEFSNLTDTPKAALASLDGQVFEALPIKRTVRQADGKEIAQNVSLSQYRALRWQVDQLPAGKTVSFSARARVEAAAVASTTTSAANPISPVSLNSKK
jgi:uncharacterized repeat protein (TIGR01451 family)